MPSHTTDWFPGRRTPEFREGWDRIFGKKTDDGEQVDSALRFFKQSGCCTSGCDCSNQKGDGCGQAIY